MKLELRDGTLSRPISSYFWNQLRLLDFITNLFLAAHQFKVNQPFNVCGLDNSFDMSVNVYGGGMTGQVEAIRLAVSRALCEVDENYRKMLKPLGLLTRDPRMVERKKFGQKKARKKFQFSKR